MNQFGYCLFNSEFEPCLFGSVGTDDRTSSFLGELQGIVFSLKQIYRMIRGSVLHVYSDNKATVEWLKNPSQLHKMKDLRIQRLQSWLTWHFTPETIRYHFVDGEQNCVADLLSRWKRKNPVKSKIDHKVQGYRQKKPDRMIQYIQSQGRMCDIGLPSQRLPKPAESERRQLIQDAHEGHWSAQRTYENLLLDLQGKWPGMRKEVDDYVRHCRSCQWHGEPLVRDDLDGPQAFNTNEIVHLDFCGPFRNKQHLLVGVDNFSRFVHAVTMTSPSQSAVIDFLESWIQLHGRIQTIFSDQGMQFMGARLQGWLTRNSVNHIVSPAYYHQANGICERMNRTIQGRIRRYLDDGMDWENALVQSVLQINRSFNRTINTVPIVLMHGVDRQGNQLTGIPELKQRVTAKVNEAKFQTSKWWKKRRKFSAALVEGDLVLLEKAEWMRQSWGKLSHRWEGPYQILSRLSPTRWAIVKLGTHPDNWIAVHSSQLKKFFQSEDGDEHNGR